MNYDALSIEDLLDVTFAQLPLAAVRRGVRAWVSNGRKTGEGAGDGTGVLAYADTIDGTVTWRVLSDDSAVEV